MTDTEVMAWRYAQTALDEAIVTEVERWTKARMVLSGPPTLLYVYVNESGEVLRDANGLALVWRSIPPDDRAGYSVKRIGGSDD